MSNTRLTIFDIAKIAGVSRSTVSRALNNDSGISDETKEKILNVIKEMNYRPNVNARRTVTRRCECLGLYIGSRVLIRDANSRVLSGIIAKCNEVAYDLVLRSSCSTDRLVEMYNEHKVDGFVILNPYPDIAPMLEFLEANNVPYACTAVCSDENKFLYVDTDNRRAAYDAVSYLIGKGHQHIALLTEEPSIFSVDLRQAGYEACMRAHDLPIPENYIVSLPPRGAGMDLQPMRRAFEGDTPPTAFFATSDEKAMRAIYWLRDNGYRVPEDISVIGFDDLPESTGEYPLTTIHQDFYMRGYVACESVLNRLNDPNRLIERRFLAHSLIERGSVRAIKDQKI